VDTIDNHHSVSPRAGSLYGYDLLNYVSDYGRYLHSAYETARHVITLGGTCSVSQGLNAIGTYDRAAFAILESCRTLGVSADAPPSDGCDVLALYVSTLGRLHIRPVSLPRPIYTVGDRWVNLGFVKIEPSCLAEIDVAVQQAQAKEAAAFRQVKQAMDRLHARGQLFTVLDQVADHIEHVDNVCFFIGDRFFGLMDRFSNLTDTKAGRGYLPQLHERDYSAWRDDEILLVAALHALFLSGGVGRFEEFNGSTLSATSLLAKSTSSPWLASAWTVLSVSRSGRISSSERLKSRNGWRNRSASHGFATVGFMLSIFRRMSGFYRLHRQAKIRSRISANSTRTTKSCSAAAPVGICRNIYSSPSWRPPVSDATCAA